MSTEAELNDADIQMVIQQLEASTPKEGSKLLIFPGEYERYYCEIEGNRNGYIRGALEFLRASIVELEPGSFATPIDFNYLVPSKGGFLVHRLSRREEPLAPPPRKKERSWRHRAAMIGCFSVFLFLAVCTFIGIAEIGTWIFAK